MATGDDQDLARADPPEADPLLRAQRIEHALREERERLRITLASIGDGVITTDIEGRVTYLNRVAESLTGWVQARAVGRPLTEVFHIIDAQTRRPVENPAARALRDGLVAELANHTLLIGHDGSERPIEDSAAAIRDEAGAPLGTVLVFRDISERKRAEEAQARLAAIVESSEDAIVSKSLDGVIRTWNAAAERMFGYTAAEAVGQSVTLIIPPERLAEETAILDRLLHGERVESFETVRVARDGRRVEISLTVSPLRDAEGHLIGASKVSRDITERKRAERALRASEGRHRFLADLALATQPLHDPAEVMAVTARLLAEHLGVDRCAYAEVEDETIFVVTGDHPRGVPSIVGRWPVAAFGPECTRLMLANEACVVSDVDADPRVGEDLASYHAAAIAAVICMPLHKDGKLTAAMAVHQKTPRRWTSEEVVLVRTVVDRCWEALERTRVARTLRASEARYRAMVEATPECVKLVAADGTVLQMNSAGLRMIEADDPARAIGQSVYTLIAPEDRPLFRAFNERVCRGERGTLVFDIIGLRGNRLRMESTAVPLPTPDGGFAQLSISRDITERAAAERALADSRARLDYAVRLSGVGFWYCDLPFNDLIWDVRTKGHFWLPPDATVTIDTFYDRIHPDDRERTRRAIEASIAGTESYDIDIRTVDAATGAIKWVRALGGTGCNADGLPIRFDGVTVDVTAQKLDEQRLALALDREREQGRLLRQIADASLAIHAAGSLERVLQVTADEARRQLGADRAFTSLTATADSAQSSTATSIDISIDAADPEDTAPPDTGGLDLEICRRNLPMRLTRAELEAHPAFHRDTAGRRPERDWLAAPLIGHDGENLGLVQLCDKRDGGFTDRDESVLVQLAHIASVAIENARLNAALRDQDRRKDEFLALLAHELRNPLAPLRSGLQVLRLSEDAALRGRSQAMMDRQLGHMVRLIDDLLDVSRITRNKLDLRRARIALAEVVRSAIETAKPVIDAARHQLTVSLPPEPIDLDADLTRLAQVFSNLLTNSAKYTDPGGRIELSAQRQGDEVLVAVRDTGIGIPPHALPNIFDMFSQVDRSIERSRGGLGIGLALVKGLVEMHGGTITAESDGLRRGCIFTVRLPALETAAPAPEPTARPTPQTATRAPRKILVVDDNEDAALTMADMLELLGDQVHTAHDGLDAITAAEAFRPEIVLMDIGMPRLNGYDATRRIREQPWGRAITIVALTGWGQETDRARSREAGCDGHLVKPVSLADLEALLAAPPRPQQ